MGHSAVVKGSDPRPDSFSWHLAVLHGRNEIRVLSACEVSLAERRAYGRDLSREML